MNIDHSREKLFHAMAFFINATRNCGKIKLFKLLYFLDFTHYQETGRSVTGMNYHAWKMGPVPVALFEGIDAPKGPFLEGRFEIVPSPSGSFSPTQIKPTFPVDLDLFSTRELRAMEFFANKYRAATAQEMIEDTHLENRPWHTVWEKQGAKQELIPYALALRAAEREEMEELIQERESFLLELGLAAS
ncbi:MAG: SocA family protein [Magnetococcales bacterium]|nr:SocA family protein [Magnetococcales bacterium]